MSFTATFTNALSGLNASTLRSQVLSFNIANSASEGYARRSVSFSPVVPGGVSANSIERASAGSLEKDILGAEARLGGAQTRADALSKISGDYGLSENPDGLYAVYARFEVALDDLRLTPENGGAQLAFLQAADDVATTFARLDREAQSMRLEADQAIANSVDRVNDALAELDALNTEARRPRGVGLDTVAERQRALVNEISAELDIRVTGEFGEVINIRTGGGLPLLGEEPAILDFSRAGSASFELSLASGDFSRLTIDGVDVTPGSVQGLSDGNIAANFAVRDVLAPDYAARLDAAAADLVSRVQGADTTAAEGLFILNVGTNSAAQRIAVNPAVDPDQGGELFRLRDGVGAVVEGPTAGDGVLGSLKAALDEVLPLSVATGTPNGYAFGDALGAIANQLGTNALRADTLLVSADQAQLSLSDQIAGQIGVDTDRELQDLLLVEQAFAANARVIQAADEMLAQLLEIA